MSRIKPFTEANVRIGSSHVPSNIASALAGSREIPSPVANVDTVPSMNIPHSAFEKKFHANHDAFKAGFAALLLVAMSYAYRHFTEARQRVSQDDRSPNKWQPLGFTILVTAVILFTSGSMIRAKLFPLAMYNERCNNSLRPFNMHFNRDKKGGIAFLSKVPKEYQTAFERYRTEHWAEQEASRKFKSGVKKGG
ncbi:hypothetical protein DFS34DRAFT_645442 [Phlyctochytrium arcticum]|nr:hypothetical protein DFS34DRAFT_645442 [Phlyctochytrium arcticum]